MASDGAAMGTDDRPAMQPGLPAVSPEMEALVFDLLLWLGTGPRPYREVMDAWRTSCPRLPVWETACERGLVERSSVGVRVSAIGQGWLKRREREAGPQRA
jgi:hypothetical protein